MLTLFGDIQSAVGSFTSRVAIETQESYTRRYISAFLFSYLYSRCRTSACSYPRLVTCRIFCSIFTDEYHRQCLNFVHLADVEESSQQLNSRFKAFTEFLVRNERVKHANRIQLERTSNATGFGSTSSQISVLVDSTQKWIRSFVDEQLTPHSTFLALCERFGLCDFTGDECHVIYSYSMLMLTSQGAFPMHASRVDYFCR